MTFGNRGDTLLATYHGDNAINGALWAGKMILCIFLYGQEKRRGGSRKLRTGSLRQNQQQLSYQLSYQLSHQQQEEPRETPVGSFLVVQNGAALLGIFLYSKKNIPKLLGNILKASDNRQMHRHF